ncbi:hypothetical protein C8F01DRAFT_1368353 [Mycena amicta]|nr:hypothetical protein C8F01DRAFT_1368353 [Mycena amicta]
MPAQARRALDSNGCEIGRICNHNTSCRKKILSRTRKEHYNGTELPWENIPSSESEPESDDDGPTFNNHPLHPPEDEDMHVDGPEPQQDDSAMASPSPPPPSHPYLDDGADSDTEDADIAGPTNPEVERWSRYEDLRGVLEEEEMSVEQMVQELQEMMLAEEDKLVFTHGVLGIFSSDEHRKRAEKLEKKLKDATTKPAKIPAPKGTAGRTVNGYELAKAMRLDGAENTELLNRLKALVRYLFPKYLTVTGTYATYKDTNKLNAAVEAIASEVPYFRRYEGLWPIHQILRSFLQNNNSRLKTALLHQKSYEEGTEVPERRKGRKRKDEGVDDGAEDIDADEEDEEMEDEEEEEEEKETVKTVAPKKKPAPSKPAPSKPTRSKPAASKSAPSKIAPSKSAPPKSAPSKSATSHKTKATNKPRKRKDDSDEEDEGWNTEFETDSEGWESAKESNSGGEDVMDSQVQLRSAQWSHDETNDSQVSCICMILSQIAQSSQPTKLRRSARDIPKKTVENYQDSDWEDMPLHESEEEIHPELLQIINDAKADLAKMRVLEPKSPHTSPKLNPRTKQQMCPLCDDVIPAKRPPELQHLLLRLKGLPDDSPAVPALERTICTEIRRTAKQDAAIVTATERGWPLKIDLATIPPRIFAMRENLTDLLTDETLLAKNPVLVDFTKLIDFEISEFERIYASGTDHKLRQTTRYYRRAAYYGYPGYLAIQALLQSFVKHALPQEQIPLTLSSVAELCPSWQLDDDCTLFSQLTFIANILTPFVTMLLIEEDLNVGFADARHNFADAVLCFDSITTWPQDDERTELLKNSQRAMKELVQQALAEEEKNRKRKPAKPAEVIDIDAKVDSKAQKRKRTAAVPKQEVVEQEEEEREPPRKKNKTSGKENQLEESKKTIHKMTVDDFPAPVIKPPRKKKEKVHKSLVKSSHSYGMRTRSVKKP